MQHFCLGFVRWENLNTVSAFFSFPAATKQLFAAFSNVQVATHELDQMGGGAAVQNELAAMTGQRSVPNVFVNKQHVGGNDDTQAANRNGTLANLLEQK